MHKSVFADICLFSYVVRWRMGKDQCRIETISRSEAEQLCATLKTQHPEAMCFRIDTSSGKVLQRLA